MPNNAPVVVNPLADQATNEDTLFSLTIPSDAFADPDAGDTLTYSATLADGAALPSWLTFNPATGIFSGTPTGNDLGTLSVKVIATDTGGLSTSDIFDLAIAALPGQIITGTTGNDVLAGHSGNDTINGLAGADTMSGKRGDDTYVVDNAGDTVIENANEGIDTVQSSVTYTLAANVENLTLTGASAINGTGNALDNVLIGNSAANVLTGGAGNDTYYVGAGDSVVELAGSGTDTVYSSVTFTLGANVENLVLTGAASINATGNTLDNQLTGNSGNNTLNGGAGADTMAGGLGNDTYVIDNAGDIVIENPGAGTDTVQSAITYTLGANLENLTLTGATAIDGTGNALNNVLTGNTANNTLTGGAGNDTINGGAGADTMIGGIGNDSYTVDNVGDAVTELLGEGTDTVNSSTTYTLGSDVENLTLTGALAIDGTGNTLNNVLTGNTANNTLIGNAGNDALNGGGGADTMFGGSGNDTYTVDNVGDVVTELAGEGTDTVNSSITYTLGADVENLTLTGAAAIDGTGSALNNVLTGNTGSNTLSGGAGNDSINGGTGADTLIGGTGNDAYTVDNVADAITELAGEGTDVVNSSVTYTLSAEVENLTLTGASSINGIGNALNNVLTGNTAANTLSGGDGNDTLNGGTGADTLIGGLGNDTYTVDNTADVIIENAGEGTDVANSSVTYTLSANVENLTLTGATSINGTGNSSDNVLLGNTAINTLSGGDGNDTLNGGSGTDTLLGGLGNDTYVVDNVGDVVTENAGEGTDLVNSSVSYTLSTNVENLTLTGASAISGTGNSLDNVLTGNSAGNTLNGGAGADTMSGGLGNDTYVVDNAADVVIENASAGTDIIQSAISYALAANVETLTLTGTNAINGTGNAQNNTLNGNAFDNFLDGGAGNDTMAAGLGNDTYIVDSLTDIVTEGANAGIDTIRTSLTLAALANNVENLVLTGSSALNATGNTLNNTITGNSAANTLNGGTGEDTLIGGAGDDIYVVDNVTDVIIENAGEGIDSVQSSVTYTLATDVDNLTLTGAAAISGTGNALDNVLTGNGAVNTLTGNAGNDTLNGGAGADVLKGGTGNDIYYVDNAGDVVTELAGEGTDTVNSSITYVLGATLENLTLTGAAAINGTGNALDNIFIGNAAVNTLTGNAGNDTLDGSAGADILKGGTGDDIYFVDNPGDAITELAGEGTDTVNSSITYTLGATLENLTLIGAAAINGNGNAGDNILTGNSAGNVLTGGAGNDTYYVSTGDSVSEAAGGGTDAVYSDASYLLDANVENLTLTGIGAINGTGNAADNVITGNTGNNQLAGADGNDILLGFDGNDTLDGGAGNDYLAGGTGADLMRGGDGDDTYIVDDAGDVVSEALPISIASTAADGTQGDQRSFGSAISADGRYVAFTSFASNLVAGDTDNASDVFVRDLLTGSIERVSVSASGAQTDRSQVEVAGISSDGRYVAFTSDATNLVAGDTNNFVDAFVKDRLTGAVERVSVAANGAQAFAGARAVAISPDGRYVLMNSYSSNLVAGDTNGTQDVFVKDRVTGAVYRASTASDGTQANGQSGSDGGGAGSFSADGRYVGFGSFATNLVPGDTNSAGDIFVKDLLTGTIERVSVASDGAQTSSFKYSGNPSISADGRYVAFESNAANLVPGDNNIFNDIFVKDRYTGAIQRVSAAADGAPANNASNHASISADGRYVVFDSLASNLGGNGWNFQTYVKDLATGAIQLVSANAAGVLGDSASTYQSISADGRYVVFDSGSSNLLPIDLNTVDDVFVKSNSLAGGVDTVQSSISYTLTTDVENLVLTNTGSVNGAGNALNNTIIGNSGNNVLDGGGGNDTMTGGAGDDTYLVDSAADVVTENANEGIDTVQSSIDFTLGANTENLMLLGSAAITGSGNTFDNTILGDSNFNILSGGAGNDVLDGGSGVDFLFGEADDDILIFDASDVVMDGGSGTDTLQISGSGETIDLSAMSGTIITGTEIIDLTGTGNNTLTLSAVDLVNLSDTSDTLRVDGNVGDVVNAGSGWTSAGTITIGAQTYAQYTQGAATLQVDTDITANIGSGMVSVIELSSLDGNNGFQITGEAVGDYFGVSVSSAGDVNGDGFDDLVIGAPFADVNGSYSGASYVVFGHAGGFTANVNLSTLDGTNGFQINGEGAGDKSGFSVASAGDINGDNFTDLIVGAYRSDVNGSESGASYVVFGHAGSFTANLDLSTLNGTNGFQISGESAFNQFGISVASAGDVNGDGYADFIVGADVASPNGTASGASYVVFGHAGSFTANVDLSTLDGTNGFQINGEAALDFSGISVESAGDVNGDGYADLIVGAPNADPNGQYSGATYVVFGWAGGFAANLNVSALDGTNGFKINGEAAIDGSGRPVSSAGDVNGDGFDDIIIGATGADPNGNFSGASYVVFGKAGGFSASLDLFTLDGSNGFQVNGKATGDTSGASVASAGDLNGDGFDDLIIGAFGADPNGTDSGASYVMFGHAGNFTANLELSELDGANGFHVNGEAAQDYSGAYASSAGDVNGDGFADLIIGAMGADANGIDSGASYVIFGRDFNDIVDFEGTVDNDTLTGNGNANVLVGGLGNDTLDGMDGTDVLNGAGGDDILGFDADDRLIDGGSGNDTLRFAGSGQSFNLALPGSLQLAGIESIDLNATGANSLSLDALSLLAMSDSTNTLRVAGTSTDSVSVSGAWTHLSNISLGGETYAQYTQGAAKLLVDTDIQTSITVLMPVLALSTLNGTNGFRLHGIDFLDNCGYSVSGAGDVNNDGFADVIVAAPQGGTGGESYVVFGHAGGFSANLDLASLNGTNGFRIYGNHIGRSVSAAGDVNGDGYADLFIGTLGSGINSNAGESYVLFGKASSFGASFDLATLSGTNGFRLDGIDANDYSGSSVAGAGDINGDGYADLIIGAFRADPGGNSEAGESYVVFGKAGGFSATLNLGSLNGTNGFRLDGVSADDQSGFSVAGAGDINGDGFADLIVGARNADPDGNNNAGESFVVFGKATGFAASVDLSTLNGTNGFRLDGASFYGAYIGAASGASVAGAGDINGDGYDDLIIGAFKANAGVNNAGASYVVFGRAAGFSASLDLAALNGTNGFRLDGTVGGYSGWSVAGAGDVNGDGYADVIIGAIGANNYTGASYVVFGKPVGFDATLELSSLNGANGFRVDGVDNQDFSGGSVDGAGDINGDGFADLIVGARGAGPGSGYDVTGDSYVIFGRDFNGVVDFEGTAGNDIFNGTSANEVAIGGSGNDQLNGGGGNDQLRGNAGNDLLDGGTGNDTMQGGVGNDNYFVDTPGDVVNENANEGTDTVRCTANYALAVNVEYLQVEGPGSIVVTGNDLSNLITVYANNTAIYGGAGDDTIFAQGTAALLNGGSGHDYVVGTHANEVLEGMDGSDTLQGDAVGSYLFNGGIGYDALYGNAGNELFIGGVDDDTYHTNSGADIIAFNRGDGQDIIHASSGIDNTLSIGGGIAYTDMMFTKSGFSLDLRFGGTSDRITLENWYEFTTNKSVLNLQVIAEAMANFDANSSDPLLNKKVQNFDFQGLVDAFDAAGNPFNWALTNELLNKHLSGSDAEAIGGDLAYQYGRNGTLAGIGFDPAVAILSNTSFGTSAQTLQPLQDLQQGIKRLS